jgi:hypothetical protein
MGPYLSQINPLLTQAVEERNGYTKFWSCVTSSSFMLYSELCSNSHTHTHTHRYIYTYIDTKESLWESEDLSMPSRQDCRAEDRRHVCLQNVGTHATLTLDSFLLFPRRTCGIGVYLFIASFGARKQTLNLLLFLNIPRSPPEYTTVDEKSPFPCLKKRIRIAKSLEHWWNNNDTLKPKYSEENLS